MHKYMLIIQPLIKLKHLQMADNVTREEYRKLHIAINLLRFGSQEEAFSFAEEAHKSMEGHKNTPRVIHFVPEIAWEDREILPENISTRVLRLIPKKGASFLPSEVKDVASQLLFIPGILDPFHECAIKNGCLEKELIKVLNGLISNIDRRLEFIVHSLEIKAANFELVPN
jgi:hypothetical protein